MIKDSEGNEIKVGDRVKWTAIDSPHHDDGEECVFCIQSFQRWACGNHSIYWESWAGEEDCIPARNVTKVDPMYPVTMQDVDTMVDIIVNKIEEGVWEGDDGPRHGDILVAIKEIARPSNARILEALQRRHAAEKK